MPSELVGRSVIFVKVAPGYVERTLTTLRAKPSVAKAEAVFGRHDIAVASSFRDTDELRQFASEVQLIVCGRAFRRRPSLLIQKQYFPISLSSNAYLLI